ncbi:unnamed protein product [Victoria cruziana]
MKFGMDTLDDMNHLKNKRIRSVADLLHPLSQVLDQTNPLIQIVHGRKSSYLGPGGLTGRTASFHIRDIHPSHYGHICPIDIFEGNNVRLIGSLAIHAKLSEKCIVGTGLERQAALNSGGSAIAEREGKIIYTDAEKIILSGNGDAISILLVMYQRSNKNTWMHQKPQVHRGKYLKKGQILADGAATVGGELALGKNKRKIKVGDKVAERHGNKDGTPVDMVFNPLGVPLRMNVGQMFECSLGLAGDLLGRHYRITPFDERYEQEASRKLMFFELYEANPFEQPVIIGKSYMLKLIHQVDDKISRCSSGNYALVTQQPLRGRAKQGGQRVGEMEFWALEGFGVAHILQEMLTYKSDHIRAHQEVLGTTIVGRRIPNPKGAPESFLLLIWEL